MKIVKGTSYRIVEDEQYVKTLRKCLETETNPLEVDSGDLHLYQVCVFDPVKNAHQEYVYVLAESPDGALGQASCSIKNFSSIEQGSFYQRSIVKQVPLMLRGWGNQIF